MCSAWLPALISSSPGAVRLVSAKLGPPCPAQSDAAQQAAAQRRMVARLNSRRDTSSNFYHDPQQPAFVFCTAAR